MEVNVSDVGDNVSTGPSAVTVKVPDTQVMA